ncbi:MAG: peptidase domain-containing ABC transporter [Cyanobium sp.]
MADPAQLLTLLRSFPFLADQPEPVLARLVEQAQLLRFSLGQPLCRHGEAPVHVHFLLQGTVRSVVMASRMPKGVATLARLEPGAVLGWTALSCGQNREILIASTECVTLAVPQVALQQEMGRDPQLSQRVRASVNPSELFTVLDQHLRQHPRSLAHEVVQAAAALAEGSVVLEGSIAQLAATALPAERLWLSAGGALPLGALVPPLPAATAGPSLRLLGLDRTALAACLDPPEVRSRAAAEPGWQDLLLERWEEQRRTLEQDAIQAAPELGPVEVEEPPDLSHQPAEAFPWHRGVGALESPIAAFRMLSDHLGLPYRRELLRRVFSDQVKRHGEASLALAGAVAESIGLHTQLLQIGVEAMQRLDTPLMVRWGHGLALIYRIGPRGLVLGVPASGNQELSLEELREQWGDEGEVLTLRVNALTPRRRFGFSWFLPALRQHRAVLIEVLIASFFVQLFGLVNPLLIQQVIDKVIINSNPSALGVLGVLLVVFAIFEGLLLCLRTFLFIDTTNRIDLALGTQIIDHLLRLPLGYFDRRPVGEVSSRIAELEKVRGFLTGTALTTILDAVFALLYIVVMLIYSWQLTLLTLSVIPVLVALTLAVSPIARKQLQSRAVASARTQGHLVEVLSSMMTVKAQNIELRSRWKWQDLYTDYVAEGFDNVLLSTTSGSISGFLNKLSSLIVIWGGAGLVLQGQLSLGGLIAFRIISGYVTGPLLRMTSIWQSVQETALSLERLADVIDHPQEAPEDNASRIIMPPIEGNILFQDISFRYKPSSPLLLKGVNLSIPRGKFVAVVGTSGSGKSTLTKLLARLYEPERGMVLVDGIDIQKVELYSLRRQIGIVPQDTVLFDGSVEENITLTNPEASSEEIIEAATVACAHEFIMDLPAGYSTQVGERGSGLSGGQRQRIAIARTILQKPRMLIMDEATSALDYQTERVVSENLMQALRGSTVLFITHRLSSIVNADLIVCMGGGAVLEAGTHQQLMAARGPYYVLFRQQGKSSSSSSSSSSSGAPPAAGLPLSLGASQ